MIPDFMNLIFACLSTNDAHRYIKKRLETSGFRPLFRLGSER